MDVIQMEVEWLLYSNCPEYYRICIQTLKQFHRKKILKNWI